MKLMDFQNEFIKYYYSIKNRCIDEYNRDKYDINTIITICNLYFAFKTFINKEYINNSEFLNNFVNNNLIKFYTNINEFCYICRNVDEHSLYLKCTKDHYYHLYCYYEHILPEIIDNDNKISIKNDKLFCIYCSSNM